MSSEIVWQELLSSLNGKKVFVTGHTGFTGSWLVITLERLGATICGFSLPPNTKPSLFEAARVGELCNTIMGDITNFDELSKAVSDFAPEIVIHLAAQPLVRLGYEKPLETFLVNTQGTANVLEACRLTESVTSVICITTDKVYENQEWDWPYRESDKLGGKDPYSGSKSAAEHVIHSYSQSFGMYSSRGMRVAVARGGNIIGGGDWATDRLVPDFARAVQAGTPIEIRYPNSTRPWQHVLALVQGYLQLASKLLTTADECWQSSWNFGPSADDCVPVSSILEKFSASWASVPIETGEASHKEAGRLSVDSSKAHNILGWRPDKSIDDVVEMTATWYHNYYKNPDEALSLCLQQISDWFGRPTMNHRGIN